MYGAPALLFAPTAGCIDTDLPAGRGYSGRSGKPLIEIAHVHHATWVMFTETRCYTGQLQARSVAPNPFRTVSLKKSSEAHVLDAAYPRSYVARPGRADLRAMGDANRGSPIPLQAGIKAHAPREENAQLRYMQRLIRALQRVTILVLSRACLSPLPRLPGFSLLLRWLLRTGAVE